MVEPSFAMRSVIDHHEYLHGASIIVSDASIIAYDFLVIARDHMGSRYVTKHERITQYEADYDKIKSSDSILIVRGRPTGVELAGEIIADFPTKKVKLVHRGSRLLEFIGETAGKKVLNWLTARNVEVILGQSVDLGSSSDGAYRTSSGETIVANCHFKFTSEPIGSSWLKETILHDSLDDHGRLMVDENLQVKGFKNIFAIGDVTDVQVSHLDYAFSIFIWLKCDIHLLLLLMNGLIWANGFKGPKLYQSVFLMKPHKSIPFIELDFY